MHKKLSLGSLLFGAKAFVSLVTMSTMVWASHENHVYESILHADDATQHAKAAVSHAKMGTKESKNPHLVEGLSHLAEAVDQGQQGHAKVSAKYAGEALKHLKQVH